MDWVAHGCAEFIEHKTGEIVEVSKRGFTAVLSPSRIAIGCAAALILSPAAAFAQLAFTAAANGGYEYDSNTFDLQHGVPTPVNGIGANGAPALGPKNAFSYGDSLYSYGAKLDANYAVSQQNFHLVVLGTEFRYNDFTLLNHSEYTFDGSWNLKFGSLIDGLVEVTRNRQMVNLYNLVNAQLALQTEQRETVKLGLNVTPEWRTEVGGYTRKIDEPLLGAPDLSLTENSGSAAVKYTGSAAISAGLEANYLRGNFSGNFLVINGQLINLAPAYRQWTVALTATDQISSVSTFIGNIGYSKRRAASDASGANGLYSASGVTGEFDYRRALTGKTTLAATLQRSIQTYLTGTGSEIDTVAGLDAIWQATSKLGVTLGYDFAYREYPDQGDTPGELRKDKQHFVNLTVEYDPLRWLTIRPYANYQIRRSTGYSFGDYDASVVGVKFSVQLQRGTPAPEQPFRIPQFQF
jgi:hypothetical protein